MNESSQCVLVGFGLLIGLMVPGMPAPVLSLADEAAACIGLP